MPQAKSLKSKRQTLRKICNFNLQSLMVHKAERHMMRKSALQHSFKIQKQINMEE